MDFKFTSEQDMLRQSVADFVAKECDWEYIRKCDEEHRAPLEILKKVGEMGWMSTPFPEKYGGVNGSMIDMGIVLEELAKGSLTVSSFVMRTSVTVGLTILWYGSEEQKNTYLPKISEGSMLASLGLTEPNSGSDAAALTTSAVLDGDEWVINGHKTFITGINVSNLILLAARTGKESKHGGISSFLFDPQRDGVEYRQLKKLGIRSAPTFDVFFNNVRIPKDALVGEVGKGWNYIVSSLEHERFGLGAYCSGAMATAYELALKHAKQREQFGKPIGKFQSIQHKLADMKMKLDISRLLTYRVGWMIDQGLPCQMESSMAKLYSSEAYVDITRNGLQIMGGYGYMDESPMQMHYRDAKLYEIGGGASEIQRNIIAKQLGL